MARNGCKITLEGHTLTIVDSFIGPTTVFQDNQSAINLAYAPNITQNSRHIHVRHHFVRDLVALGIIKIVHISTAIMYADLLTKPHPPAIHMRQTAKMLNIPVDTTSNLKNNYLQRINQNNSYNNNLSYIS